MNTTPLMTRDGLIHLEDLPNAVLTAAAIGETLSKINRYAGRTAEPFSVAAHSVLVSRLCPHKEEQAWGLLHDAHEAFIGDIISPAVAFISQQGTLADPHIASNVRLAKAHLDCQIQTAWVIDPSHVDLEEVAHYDRIALEAEMFFFFEETPDWCEDHERAIDVLRGLPNSGNWRSSFDLWVSEIEQLAHFGACRLPSPETHQAA